MLSADIRQVMSSAISDHATSGKVLEAHFDKHTKCLETIVPFHESSSRKENFTFDVTSGISWMLAATACSIPIAGMSATTSVDNLTDRKEVATVVQRLKRSAINGHKSNVFIRTDRCIPSKSINDSAKGRPFAGLSTNFKTLKKDRFHVSDEILAAQYLSTEPKAWLMMQEYAPGQRLHQVYIHQGMIDIARTSASVPESVRELVVNFAGAMISKGIRPYHPMMSEFGIEQTYVVTIAELNGRMNFVNGQIYIPTSVRTAKIQEIYRTYSPEVAT